MTPDELLELANRTKAQGGSSLYLKFPIPKSKPPFGYEIHPRIRTIFGVCSVMNATVDNHYAVSVPIDRIFKVLALKMKEALDDH